ncbi:MAG: hypothetical protein M9958_03475 [Chitinophagales bacterium]|nr:hypothetical protein [Chitinophagales bacterium]
MNPFKKITLSFLFLLSLTTVTAQTQKTSNHFEVKFDSGTKLEMNSSFAILSPDNKITIIGFDKNATPSPTFQIELIPTNATDKRAFTKGYYRLNSSDQRLYYVPGESFSYDLKMTYVLLSDEQTIPEWNTDLVPEPKGFLEIESITDTRIKGKFYCEMIERFPNRGAKKTAEGTFDVQIIVKK